MSRSICRIVRGDWPCRLSRFVALPSVWHSEILVGKVSNSRWDRTSHLGGTGFVANVFPC